MGFEGGKKQTRQIAYTQALAGREIRIIEMEEEVNELYKKLGIEPKYPPI